MDSFCEDEYGISQAQIAASIEATEAHDSPVQSINEDIASLLSGGDAASALQLLEAKVMRKPAKKPRGKPAAPVAKADHTAAADHARPLQPEEEISSSPPPLAVGPDASTVRKLAEADDVAEATALR